jgi:hypothetical protein
MKTHKKGGELFWIKGDKDMTARINMQLTVLFCIKTRNI